MHFFKKLFFTIFTLIVATSAFADTTATTPSGQTLSQLLKSMHSMQANFTQTIKDKKGRTIQKSTGHMDLQRPNQFRWDVRAPNKQLIVTNGKRLWVYDPDLEQVTIRALGKAAGDTPAMLLSDADLQLDKEFVIRPVKNASSIQWYTLLPKDPSSVIAAMKLGFDKQQIQQMEIQDHLGHTTLIVFNNIKENVPISSALFIFKPPAHIDVIDETKR